GGGGGGWGRGGGGGEGVGGGGLALDEDGTVRRRHLVHLCDDRLHRLGSADEIAEGGVEASDFTQMDVLLGQPFLQCAQRLHGMRGLQRGAGLARQRCQQRLVVVRVEASIVAFAEEQ